MELLNKFELCFLESEERATSGSGKDELSDILGPHFNLVNMVRQTGN